jgi:hypothetical protein
VVQDAIEAMVPVQVLDMMVYSPLPDMEVLLITKPALPVLVRVTV